MSEREPAASVACSHGPGCPLPWSVHDWSYEAMMADPTWQTPLDSEILPHLLAFGPPGQHVHGYSRQTNGTTACPCGQVLGSDTAAVKPAARREQP